LLQSLSVNDRPVRPGPETSLVGMLTSPDLKSLRFLLPYASPVRDLHQADGRWGAPSDRVSMAAAGGVLTCADIRR